MAYLALPNDPKDQCVCGRWNNKIHCPACGCYTVYGLASKKEIVEVNGVNVVVPCYRCRKCTLTFNDFQWKLKCEAPKFESSSMADKRLKEQAQQQFIKTMEEAKARGGDEAVAEARKKLLQNLFKNKQPAVKTDSDPLDFNPDKQD